MPPALLPILPFRRTWNSVTKPETGQKSFLTNYWKLFGSADGEKNQGHTGKLHAGISGTGKTAQEIGEKDPERASLSNWMHPQKLVIYRCLCVRVRT